LLKIASDRIIAGTAFKNEDVHWMLAVYRTLGRPVGAAVIVDIALDFFVHPLEMVKSSYLKLSLWEGELTGWTEVKSPAAGIRIVKRSHITQNFTLKRARLDITTLDAVVEA